MDHTASYLANRWALQGIAQNGQFVKEEGWGRELWTNEKKGLFSEEDIFGGQGVGMSRVFSYSVSSLYGTWKGLMWQITLLVFNQGIPDWLTKTIAKEG